MSAHTREGIESTWTPRNPWDGRGVESERAAPGNAWAALQTLLQAMVAGVLLLDALAMVLDMNPAALEMIQSEDGLVIKDSRLRALRASDDLRLQRMLRSAIANRRAKSADRILAVPRRSGRCPYLAVAMNVPKTRNTPGARSARAIVCVIDPDQDVPLSEHALRSLWGLTNREAQVTARIVGGLTLGNAAQSLAISEAAVRFHMRNAFRKMNAHEHAAVVPLAMRSAGGLRL